MTVDVVHLPYEPESWPQVGLVLALEVLQHRPANRTLMPR